VNAIGINADIGITTAAVAKRIGRGAKLYSLEPMPEYYNILKENVPSNGLENVKAYELAVTELVGRAYFYRKGLSTGIIFEGGAKKSGVSTTTIDSFLSEEKMERIDLINIDCEGSELLVIKGAGETLRKNKVKIFCEVHQDSLKQLG